MVFRGLLFDFDGLILDTDTPYLQTYCELYESYGCTMTVETWTATVGTSGYFDPLANLEQQIGRPLEQSAILVQCDSRERALRKAQAALAGVHDYLRDGRRLEMKLGIASNSKHEWMEPDLLRLGILDHFDCIVGREDVSNLKPDPEPYLRALAELRLHHNEVIALEDSASGVEAAKSAGLFCVAVPNTFTARHALDRADLRLRSLAEMPLSELIEFASRIRT